MQLLFCVANAFTMGHSKLSNFKRKLGINIERISEIMFNKITLQTNYLNSNIESGLWMRQRFELNSWNIAKSIAIYD